MHEKTARKLKGIEGYDIRKARALSLVAFRKALSECGIDVSHKGKAGVSLKGVEEAQILASS